MGTKNILVKFVEKNSTIPTMSKDTRFLCTRSQIGRKCSQSHRLMPPWSWAVKDQINIIPIYRRKVSDYHYHRTFCFSLRNKLRNIVPCSAAHHSYIFCNNSLERRLDQVHNPAFFQFFVFSFQLLQFVLNIYIYFIIVIIRRKE